MSYVTECQTNRNILIRNMLIETHMWRASQASLKPLRDP